MNESDINTRRDGDEPKAPPALIAALKELPPRRVFVPPAIDAAILKAARAHLTPPERPQGFFRSWMLWPALAAACFVLVTILHLASRSDRTSFAREDVNHDGRVDILDAFQLSRELRSGQKPASTLDLNGDGVVDGQDADIVAAHAVSLEKGSRS